MNVIIVGNDPEKLHAAAAAVEAAGFYAHGVTSELEALATCETQRDLFALVMGGAIDDAAFDRIARALRPRGPLLLRTRIGSSEPRAHFELDVIPRLRAAWAEHDSNDAVTRVAVIVGSVRTPRFADVPAGWLQRLLAARSDVAASVLDLRDFPMPYFDDPVPPAMKKAPYQYAEVEHWTKAIAHADAFLVVSAEYNHGYTAVLKNAMDWVYREWSHKPIGFVAYGFDGGARVVEQLRQVVVELNMVPLRRALHLPKDLLMSYARGDALDGKLSALESQAHGLFDELLEWHRTLTIGRTAHAR